MTQAELDTELEEARSLLYAIESDIDDGQIDAAGKFASMLADVLYKARLLELKLQADEAQDPDPMDEIRSTPPAPEVENPDAGIPALTPASE